MRWVCLSDTHNLHGQLLVPAGEVLVHAGDATLRGSFDEIRAFLGWFAALPHPHKILVAGNHDFGFEKDPGAARQLVPPGITYLQDEGCEVEGVKVWGSPWQPWFYDWAFNLLRGPQIRAKWDLIPEGTEVLITHGPPARILDQVDRGPVGCEDLLARVQTVRPKLHVFGHIHEGAGQIVQGGTRFVNASICDRNYLPINPVIVVDF